MRFEPESLHGANAGLIIARDFMEKVKQEFSWISYGDLWTLGGVAAIQVNLDDVRTARVNIFTPPPQGNGWTQDPMATWQDRRICCASYPRWASSRRQPGCRPSQECELTRTLTTLLKTQLILIPGGIRFSTAWGLWAEYAWRISSR